MKKIFFITAGLVLLLSCKESISMGHKIKSLKIYPTHINKNMSNDTIFVTDENSIKKFTALVNSNKHDLVKFAPRWIVEIHFSDSASPKLASFYEDLMKENGKSYRLKFNFSDFLKELDGNTSISE